MILPEIRLFHEENEAFYFENLENKIKFRNEKEKCGFSGKKKKRTYQRNLLSEKERERKRETMKQYDTVQVQHCAKPSFSLRIRFDEKRSFTEQSAQKPYTDKSTQSLLPLPP